MKKRTADICRILLGVVFAFSGVVKAIDPLGTVYKIEDYLKAFGGFAMDLMPLASVGAYALILAECVLAGMLIMRAWPRVSSVLTVVFYAVMTPLTLWIALTNPVSDCGCFGDALVLTNWQTFAKNVVLIALAIVWLCLEFGMKEPRRLFNQPKSHVSEIVAIVLGVLLMAIPAVYSQLRLPILDFRPYKVGANIPELMEIPEDAEPDIYETTLFYEKDGKIEAFSLQDYPKGDSTWTFVDQKSKLVKKGYEAPVHDFEILNSDYEDITYDLLETDDLVTLCIMYDIAKADPEKREQIEQLARESDLFYVVTGSGEEAIKAYGLSDEVQVCTCDPVTLKTVVRANPGIVEIQSGVILRKYRL